MRPLDRYISLEAFCLSLGMIRVAGRELARVNPRAFYPVTVRM